MSEELPPLGPLKAWLVKEFPVSLREEITRAAAGKGVTVGEWLVAHFQRHGIDGVEISAAKLTEVNPAIDVVRLAPLVASMPRWLRSALWRRVARELGVEPPAARAPKRLLEG